MPWSHAVPGSIRVVVVLVVLVVILVVVLEVVTVSVAVVEVVSVVAVEVVTVAAGGETVSDTFWRARSDTSAKLPSSRV